LQIQKASIKANTSVTAKMLVSNAGYSGMTTVLDNKGITWKSSKTKVAKVSQSGKITGKGAGKTNISGALKYYKASETLAVTANLTKKQVKANVGKVTSLTSKKTKKAVAKVKKVDGITGYQIQIATDSKMKSNKKTVTTKKTTYTFSKLKSKKKYYVRSRVYKVIGGKKVYGKWGSVKKVKIK
jgi:hypothetical protein